VAALSQVKKVVKEENNIEFIFDDEIMVEMISASRNKNLIDEFFKKYNLNYNFVSKEKSKARGKELSDLSKLLGDKLKIDN
ncbi:MAG: hypothetical protein IJT25_00600, partial [Clostridia bacterium]|nr:hypothetical protein [Clostridia bacterium]